jgi:hypothetical protein
MHGDILQRNLPFPVALTIPGSFSPQLRVEEIAVRDGAGAVPRRPRTTRIVDGRG